MFSDSSLGNEMSQQENTPGRRLRSERRHSTVPVEDGPTKKWSHEEVVSHGLAGGRKTLDQLRIVIESSLDEYFEKESTKDWAAVIKRVAISLPHGLYELRSELYRTLQPDIYPYDDEADRQYVGKAKEHQESEQPQRMDPWPRLKRCVVTDSEDEEIVKPAEKKAKTETDANIVQESAYDSFTSQALSEPHSLPGSVIIPQAPEEAQEFDTFPEVFTALDSETKSERSRDVDMDGLKKEIKAWTEQNRKTQKWLKEAKEMKASAVRLQRKVSTGRSLFKRSLEDRKAQNRFIQGKSIKIIQDKRNE
jgi:hypothetical protein